MSDKRLALYCSSIGLVTDVIRDDLGVLRAEHDVLLPALATPDGSARCFEMLEELRGESMVFGWLIELNTPSGPIGLHFAGVHHEDKALLVASETLHDVESFTEELMRVNNEHVNTLRELIRRDARAPGTNTVLSRFTELSNEITALQRELAQRSERLDRLVGEKTLLLGMAAHDIRSPLLAILFGAARLSESRTLSEENRRVVGQIEMAASYMERCLRSTLDSVAIELGGLQIEKRPCDLVDTLEEVRRMNEVFASWNNVTLEIDAPPTVRMAIDATKFLRVLNNLVANAVNHAPPHSVVEISVRESDSEIAISVRDHGPGVGRDPDRLFDPLVSGEVANKRAGYGLGLAVARDIVRAHGGHIRAENVEPTGSRFTVNLPRE